MNTEQRVIPEHRHSPLHISGNDLLGLSGLALLLLCVIGAIVYLNWHTWGMWALIGAGIVIGVIAGWKVYTSIHSHALHHIDRRHDHKMKQHYRDLTTQALAMHHSVKLEHVDTNGNTWKMETVSPLTIPNAPVKVNEINIGQEQQALPAPHVEQPRLETIIEQLTENALEIPFGTNRETGQLVTSTLTKAVHLSSIGDSGGGKSRGAQGILTALTAKNDKEHLQFAFIDAESETTLPFQQLPQVGYLADDPPDAARVLAELVRLKRQRDITKITLPFILLFCEEFLILKQQMPASVSEQALEDFTELACTGRKRNIAIYTIGQTRYSDKRIRDAQAQFQTNMAYPIHPQRARAAGFIETPLLNQLYKEKRTGQFVLEHKGDNAIILAPFVDARTVSNILVPSQFRASSEPVPIADSLCDGNQDGNYSEPVNETLELVRKMVVDEKGMSDIASTAFPGMRKEDALKEVRRCMRQLVQR